MSIINPNATFIVFNYTDRLGMKNLSIKEDEVTQITCKTSVISIKTNKSKSSSSGTFEVQLAPDRNWVSAITPGSWCVILMSRNNLSTEIPAKPSYDQVYSKIEDSVTSGSNAKTVEANEQELKMVGRIDSVRVSSIADANGAIKTAYLVTGVDWGSVFDTTLYIDPQAELAGAAEQSIAKNNLFLMTLAGLVAKTKDMKKSASTPEKSATQQAQADVGAGSESAKVETADVSNNATNLSELTSSKNIKNILKVWGSTTGVFESSKDDIKDGALGRTSNEFRIPERLAKYLGFVDSTGQAIVLMKDLIKFRGGVLIDNDKYSDIDDTHDVSRNDGYAIVDYGKFFGINNVWQVLMAHSNPAINEMLCDIRFEKQNGVNLPLFTLYKRVKPFGVNSEDIIFEGQTVYDKNRDEASREYTKRLLSKYKFLRKIEISLEDIISVNAGTNWRDKINFIDITLDRSPFREFFLTNYKPLFQIFDKKSVRRDGVLRLCMNTDYLPMNKTGETYDINNFGGYRYLGKEWYFDTHKMLNGAISLVGQNKYIQVGDNILIPIQALGTNYNMSYAIDNKKNVPNSLYLMAHVENVSHSFFVDQNGARSFLTDIQFVRGIVCDKNGDQPTYSDSASDKAVALDSTLDQDSGKLSNKSNYATTIKTAYTNDDKPGTFGQGSY